MNSRNNHEEPENDNIHLPEYNNDVGNEFLFHKKKKMN